jgi:hypothetical protein
LKLLNYEIGRSGENYIEFTITHQDQLVYDFFAYLKRMGKDHFMSSEGIKITSKAIPEYKDSTNTLYLRGSDKSLDFKVDYTPTAVGTNDVYRKGKINMIKNSLAEFVTAVKKAANAGLLVEPTYTMFTNNLNTFLCNRKPNVGNCHPWTGQPLYNINAPVSRGVNCPYGKSVSNLASFMNPTRNWVCRPVVTPRPTYTNVECIYLG